MPVGRAAIVAPLGASAFEPLIWIEAGHALPGGSVALPEAYVRFIAVARVCTAVSSAVRFAFFGNTSGSAEIRGAVALVGEVDETAVGWETTELTREVMFPPRNTLAVATIPSRMPTTGAQRMVAAPERRRTSARTPQI